METSPKKYSTDYLKNKWKKQRKKEQAKFDENFGAKHRVRQQSEVRQRQAQNNNYFRDERSLMRQSQIPIITQ